MPVVADIVAVVTNALFFALALPLALRLVPINYFYGYRTAKSTSDEKAWYAMNAAFGIWTSAIAGVAFAAGAIMLGVRYGTDLPFWEFGFALLYAVLPIALIAGCVAAARAAEKLSDSSDGQ